jgi:hypothetical protein
MFSHRIKNAIQFGTEAGLCRLGIASFSEDELRDMAKWLDAHPSDGTFAQYVEELEDAN